MELNKDQIEHLFKFTEQHYVEWYDVQCELVDHLANDIEHILDKQPDLSFEMARNKAFKKFGVMGFGEVVAQKHKALNKSYWRMVWQIFKEYFRLPKILLSVGTTVLLFLFLKNFNMTGLFMKLVFILYASVGFGFTFVTLRKIKKNARTSKKKWLFNQITGTIGEAGHFLYIPLQILILIKIENYTLTNFATFIVALLTVILFLHLYISIVIVPKKMVEKMSKQFPEYQVN